MLTGESGSSLRRTYQLLETLSPPIILHAMGMGLDPGLRD